MSAATSRWFFDRQNVVVSVDVDLVDHRSQRGGFTGTGRSRNEHQPAGLFAHVLDDRRQAQRLERFDLVRDRAEHRTDSAFLVEKVRTETRHPLKPEREVQLEVFLESVLLCVREHRVREPLRVSRGQRPVFGQLPEVPVHAHLRGGVGGKVQVGAAGVRHFAEQVRQCYLRFD